jgi:hypothetical protein
MAVVNDDRDGVAPKATVDVLLINLFELGGGGGARRSDRDMQSTPQGLRAVPSCFHSASPHQVQ